MPFIFRYLSKGLAASAGIAGVMATASGITAGLTAFPSEAQAQGFFSFWDAPPPRKVKRQRVARIAPEEKAVAEPQRPTAGPLVINVSLRNQRLAVYDAHGLIAESPVSSGRVGYATPTGIFTIIQKNKVHFSNLYDNAPMPNMQRLTQSGVALHAGALPGYPASHGCIRLPYGFSQKLFGMTTLGTRVIVSRDPVAPASITHQRLFAALPPETPISTAAVPASTQVADASNRTAGPSHELINELGVTPAHAAEPPAVAPEPKKPTFRDRWKAEMARLADAVTSAERTKAQVMAGVTIAAKTVDDAIGAVKRARAEAERRAEGARKALAAKKDAEREFASFAKKIKSRSEMTDAEIQKAAAQEDALEAKAYGLGDAAEAAAVEAANAKAAVKTAEAAAIEAATAKRAAVTEATKAHNVLTAAVTANEAAKRRDAKRALPVSIFISRATQRLYVRQGYEPIFEAPVTFEAPEQSIGTHIFTALDYAPSKTDMVWSVSTVGGSYSQGDDGKKWRTSKTSKGEKKPAPAVAAPSPGAGAALERITISDEVREQIADIMKPGSSVVVSDYGISHETGKYTDFIILTRN